MGRSADMTAVTRFGWIAYGLAAGVIVLDQVTKHWIVSQLAMGQSMPIFGPLTFTLVENPGVSYGLLQSHSAWARWGLVVFAFGVGGVLAFTVRKASRWITAISLGLIIGGAVGNPIDRITQGAVIDFINFSDLHFPWVFNIADSAITVGVMLLIVEAVLPPRRAT